MGRYWNPEPAGVLEDNVSRAISDRGKVALVTGGTDGVGKEIARGLARRGRRVIVVGRDARKGSLAERELREATGNAEVYFVPADLSLAGDARVVLVSGAARNGRIYFDDVNLTNNFNTLRVVWQFCQANDTFAVEFARRSDGNGSGGGVTITCLKLGVVKTNIRWEFPRWMRWLVPLVFDPLLAQAPREAAEPALSLLLGYRFEGLTGALFMKVRRFKRVAPAGEVRDPEYGRRLWGLSERLSEKMHDSSSPPDAGDTQSLDFRSGAA
jgi:hypothetical protein